MLAGMHESVAYLVVFFGTRVEGPNNRRDLHEIRSGASNDVDEKH